MCCCPNVFAVRQQADGFSRIEGNARLFFPSI